MKVRGKTIVVTGGGDGIGRALSLLLIQSGARVAAVDINEAALEETITLAGDYQGMLSTHRTNITDREAVSLLPMEVIQAHGDVDGVINNAGIIQRFVRLNELDFEEMERVLNVNFWGTVNITKAFLPHLLQRPEAHIVNTSSMGGFLPVPGQTVYGASKAAVKLFTEGLRSELLATNVQVSLAFPGATATNISANSNVTINFEGSSEEQQKFKVATPAAAAQMLVDGMEKNEYHILIGSDAKMMYYLSRLMPERAAKMIYSQMRALLPD